MEQSALEIPQRWNSNELVLAVNAYGDYSGEESDKPRFTTGKIGRESTITVSNQ